MYLYLLCPYYNIPTVVTNETHFKFSVKITKQVEASNGGNGSGYVGNTQEKIDQSQKLFDQLVDFNDLPNSIEKILNYQNTENGQIDRFGDDSPQNSDDYLQV